MNTVAVSHLDTVPCRSRPDSRAMSGARLLGAYLTELKLELVRVSRAPVFVIPMVLLPPALYFLFAVVIAGASPEAKGHAAQVGIFFFTGFATFAVVGPALFGVGCSIAIERDQGLLRLKRALPAPA